MEILQFAEFQFSIGIGFVASFNLEYPNESELCLFEFTIDSGGHFCVTNGDSSRVVGDEAQADLVVADVDVWMMTSCFGQLSNSIDEGHCVNEVRKLPVADKFA